MHPQIQILTSTLLRPASSGVHRLEEVVEAISETDDMFFDGIDPRVISMFGLHVPTLFQPTTTIWVRSITRSG
jgi:hypothetical protein